MFYKDCSVIESSGKNGRKSGQLVDMESGGKMVVDSRMDRFHRYFRNRNSIYWFSGWIWEIRQRVFLTRAVQWIYKIKNYA